MENCIPRKNIIGSVFCCAQFPTFTKPYRGLDPSVGHPSLLWGGHKYRSSREQRRSHWGMLLLYPFNFYLKKIYKYIIGENDIICIYK
jgi:hypothetical protein